MIKKSITLAIVFFVFISSVFCANLDLIDFSKIKKAKKYQTELLPVKDNNYMFTEYHNKSNWSFMIPYDDCAYAIEDLYNAICNNEEKNNTEYYLLKAVASDYLYNFDKIDFKVVEQNYLDVMNMKNHDYRTEWFLAKFYACATRTKEALEIVKNIIDKVPDNKINPVAYYDYGIVYMYSCMPGSAKKAFEKYGELSGYSVENIPYYKGVNESLLDYDGTALNINNVFRNFELDGQPVLYSRFMGSMLALRSDWEIAKGSSVGDSSFYFSLKSEKIEGNGKEISYSINPFICATQDPDSSFAYQMLDNIKSKNSVKEVKFKTNIKNLKAYEYTNKDIYPDVGGSHGMLVIFTVDYSSDADSRIDFLSAPKKEDGSGITYFKLNEELRRYEGPVTYAFLLDSCEYIYKQSVKEFIEFLNNSKFE